MKFKFNSGEGTITLPIADYLAMFERVQILQALENIGVDSWSGWDEVDTNAITAIVKARAEALDFNYDE